MEIVKKFGYREYIFHSEKDANFADRIWKSSNYNCNDFEELLDENKIEYEYEL